jgi:anaerobic magnesium-protoporphyrin IX monomethyl ester cyclase
VLLWHPSWKPLIVTEILFGQAYYLRFDPKLYENMQPYPPLGCLYAAAYLRERNYEVSVFDAMLAESEEGWDRALATEKPKYAILYEDNFNYLSKMCLLRMRTAAFEMIRMAKSRACTVIVCGSDASDHVKKYMDEGADYILIGEGEETLGALMDILSGHSNTPLAEVDGLAFQEKTAAQPQSQNIVQIGKRRNVIKDIDAIPRPAWDLIDIEAYRDIWLQRHGYFSMNMVTTRGCPYHCNWCAKPIWGQRYNVRAASSIAKEMEYLHKTYRVDHIWFADDIMGLKPGWFRTLASELDSLNLRLPFKCLSRADLVLRGDTIESLAKSGCEIIWLGAESGSQEVLDAMDKGTKIEEIYEAARRLHQTDVQFAFFIQFGYPGETYEDIELTLKMIRECAPDEIGISVSYPLPGTKFYDAVKKELRDKQNWTDSADLDMMYRGTFVTEFYRQLHKVVHKEFKAIQTLRHFRRVAQHPTMLKRRDLRRIAGLIYRASSLPFARRKLKELSKIPHEGVGALPAIMSHEEAAIPSPQVD